jgi:hypothetical protein
VIPGAVLQQVSSDREVQTKLLGHLVPPLNSQASAAFYDDPAGPSAQQ